MFYLLWGLLNIGLFLFFIVICFKAAKLIREKLGIFASVLFVFGLLSFVATSNEKDEDTEPSTNIPAMWKPAPTVDTLQKYAFGTVEMILEKNLAFDYNFNMHYRIVGDNNIPTWASSGREGFVGGTSWKPVIISVNPTKEKNQFKYEIDGLVEWKLLGLKVYSQARHFEGLATGK